MSNYKFILPWFLLITTVVLIAATSMLLNSSTFVALLPIMYGGMVTVIMGIIWLVKREKLWGMATVFVLFTTIIAAPYAHQRFHRSLEIKKHLEELRERHSSVNNGSNKMQPEKNQLQFSHESQDSDNKAVNVSRRVTAI